MPDNTYNVLTEPLISVRSDGRSRQATLPEVLALLAAREAIEFPALAPFQRHAWHAFLVQLAAVAMHRAGQEALSTDEGAWRHLLLALTGNAPEPWSLVVPDLSQPALLQPPSPEGDWQAFKRVFETPDEMDVLVTGRNHDLKRRRAVEALPELWLYALVSVQTMGGYEAAGYYQIARMNGGYSSRPAIAAARSTRWCDRFGRDVRVWLEARDELLAGAYGYRPDGVALMWLQPWDGVHSLPIGECDPFFIEICRRLRLAEVDGRIQAHFAPTRARRTDAEFLKGNTGDIWVPLRIEGDATVGLTIKGSGFGYRLLQDILFGGNYHRPPAMRIRDEDGEEPVIIAQALARDQGKTQGYHERYLPIPAKVRPFFCSREGLSQLGLVAKERVEVASNVAQTILRPALWALLRGPEGRPDPADARPTVWLQAFDRGIDAVFFSSLWEDLHLDPDERRARWIRQVVGLAHEVLQRAIRAVPYASAARPRQIACAENVFWARASQYKSELTEKEEKRRDDASDTDR